MSPNVAYPGPAGSHTVRRRRDALPDATRSCRSSASARSPTRSSSHDATFGVLPIESSLAGAVAETHDLLYERALSIVGETILPIRHCLAASADIALDEIRIVRSHPTALEQCRDLLARMPNASVDRGVDDGRRRRQAAEDGDPTVAAIVRRRSGRALRARRCSSTTSATRSRSRASSRSRRTRASIATCATRARRSRSRRTTSRARCIAAIEPFARAGLDLVRLVSRPLPATPWKYRFDAVVAGHPLEPAVQVALRELDAVTRTLRVVGVYEGHAEEGA